MKYKFAAQLLVGILISAFFLYLVLPSLHLQEVWQALGQANYWWLIPGVGVYIVGLWGPHLALVLYAAPPEANSSP